MRKVFFLALLSGVSLNVRAQQTISRKDLLTAETDSSLIRQVDVKEITMSPGQHAPVHRHPCDVAGYVIEGTLYYQVKGEPARIFEKGSAFFESAGSVIAHFDNASMDEPLKFVAFYLNNGEPQLIEALPDTE